MDRDFAHFFEDWTKIKTLSEIQPTLHIVSPSMNRYILAPAFQIPRNVNRFFPIFDVQNGNSCRLHFLDDLGQELLNQMDRTLRACAKIESSNLGLILRTQITPRGWIFWTIIFHHQKIQVKIYLMRGQTQQFFDKLSEITDFGLLHQSQNRTRF